MDPIHVRLNMYCIFKAVDVNLLENFKEIYFLHYPHFPLPCCVCCLLTPCWQIVYFGQFMSPIFYSFKRKKYHSVVQQSKCIYYIHSSPLLSALHSRALIQLSMLRVQSHFTTQQNGKTEYQRCTYSNGLSPLSSIILLSWLCIQQIAQYPETIITLQSSRVSCYLNEKMW